MAGMASRPPDMGGEASGRRCLTAPGRTSPADPWVSHSLQSGETTHFCRSGCPVCRTYGSPSKRIL